MKFKEIIRNPLLSSIVLTSLFVVSFAVGPYHSPTALAVLFAGIATMLLWVNLTGVLNSNAVFKTEIDQLNELIKKVNAASDSEALTKMTARAAEKKASPGLSLHTKAFYEQVHEHLRAHPYTDLEVLKTHFETLSRYSSQLQTQHRTVTITGSLATFAGFAVQMAALFRPEETRVSLQRWGSGTFTLGFAVAAFYHLFVATRLAHHQSQASLMREALREEYESYLFSRIPIARLATAESPPTAAAGTGALIRADEVAVDEGQTEGASEADSPPALRARLPVPATPA